MGGIGERQKGRREFRSEAKLGKWARCALFGVQMERRGEGRAGARLRQRGGSRACLLARWMSLAVNGRSGRWHPNGDGALRLG